MLRAARSYKIGINVPPHMAWELRGAVADLVESADEWKVQGFAIRVMVEKSPEDRTAFRRLGAYEEALKKLAQQGTTITTDWRRRHIEVTSGAGQARQSCICVEVGEGLPKVSWESLAGHGLAREAVLAELSSKLG